MATIASIHFFFENAKPGLRNVKKLKRFISLISETEGKQLSQLNYIFCSDEDLLKINQQYLNHDFYTDVISFNFLGPGSEVIVAEIYISVERVKENAKRYEVPFENELHRVIFHGLLHLCGYRDKTNPDQKKMKSKEDRLLNEYFGKNVPQ